MSKADGNQPDPNELNLPDDGEQLDGLEELDLPDTDASDPLQDLGDLDLPAADAEGLESFDGGGFEEVAAIGEGLSEVSDADIEQAESGRFQDKKKLPAEPREGIGTAGMAVFGVCGLSVLLLLALDAMVFLGWGFLFMLLMNVFWLMATAIPFIMWMGRKTLNFYEVVLGISLAGIIIAVTLLLVEMVDYEGEVKAKSAASAVQLGSDRTIAVA